MSQPAKPYIVIAEDDKAYGKVYLHELTNQGFEVTLINNGADVLPSLQSRKPDLLLLDLIMPGMDGFDVLKHIRAIPELADLRVIVASNLSQDIDKEKVAQYQIYDYFVKADVSILEVTERVRSAVKEVG